MSARKDDGQCTRSDDGRPDEYVWMSLVVEDVRFAVLHIRYGYVEDASSSRVGFFEGHVFEVISHDSLKMGRVVDVAMLGVILHPGKHRSLVFPGEDGKIAVTKLL